MEQQGSASAAATPAVNTATTTEPQILPQQSVVALSSSSQQSSINSNIISPTDTVCLHTNDDKYFFVRLDKTTTQIFKKKTPPVDLSAIIGKNYNTFWEVEKPSMTLKGPLDYNPYPQQTMGTSSFFQVKNFVFHKFLTFASFR